MCVGMALMISAGVVNAQSGIDVQDFEQIERGRYLDDRRRLRRLPHASRQRSRLMPGDVPSKRPSGTLIAPNITPDQQTGIGTWTDEEFVNSLTKGTGRNGTHLFPAMPYTYYTKVTRDDALAIRAYLNTVPPVQNLVNADQLPFPLKHSRVDDRLEHAVLHARRISAGNANKSDEWNRGAYLAEGLGHCGLCHSPKNFLGGDSTSRGLRGLCFAGLVRSEHHRRCCDAALVLGQRRHRHVP